MSFLCISSDLVSFGWSLFISDQRLQVNNAFELIFSALFLLNGFYIFTPHNFFVLIQTTYFS